jgi:Zn-dependent peptidase ImmA (M78 family)
MFKKLKEQTLIERVKKEIPSDLSEVERQVIFGNLMEEVMMAKELDKKEFINSVMPRFFDIVKKHLQIEDMPKVNFLTDKIANTFGLFHPENGGSIDIVIINRHPVDSLRTLAHELVHWKQMKKDELTPESGKTGSDQENEANSLAGIIMRDFNHAHPDCLNYE